MATIRKPGIYGNVKKFVRRCDQYLSKKLFIDFLETNRVSSFLFHSIFTDEEQIAKNIVDPQQGITLTNNDKRRICFKCGNQEIRYHITQK